MCGRFTLFTKAEVLQEQFKIAVPKYTHSYNIAPSQQVLAVLSDNPHEAVPLKWGLVPSWAKDAKIGYKMINARAETIQEKPSFKGLIQYHRCIILADGFYEWKRKNKLKIPYYITMKDSKPFAFAGLWSRWQNLNTCTIITTDANSLMKKVHHRMPVILDDVNAWLRDGKMTTLDAFPSTRMQMVKVNDTVNSWKNNDSSLIQAKI